MDIKEVRTMCAPMPQILEALDLMKDQFSDKDIMSDLFHYPKGFFMPEMPDSIVEYTTLLDFLGAQEPREYFKTYCLNISFMANKLVAMPTPEAIKVLVVFTEGLRSCSSNGTVLVGEYSRQKGPKMPWKELLEMCPGAYQRKTGEDPSYWNSFPVKKSPAFFAQCNNWYKSFMIHQLLQRGAALEE